MQLTCDLFKGNKPAASPCPPKVATDIVYPVHLMDDTALFRLMVFNWSLFFPDILDPEKLHAALTKLLSTGDWRKLAGRPRLKPDGRLELHAPAVFTDSRPAVRFEHLVLDRMRLEEHPLARQLPRTPQPGSTLPTLHPGPHHFRELGISSDVPSTVDALMKTDEPPMCLRVTTFADGTVVALSSSHVVADVMGCHAIAAAWTRALHVMTAEEKGEPLDLSIPPLAGAQEDIFERVTLPCSSEKGTGALETYKLRGRQMKGLRLARHWLSFRLETLRYPSVEARTILLPGNFVFRLREQALADLKQDVPPSSSDNEKGTIMSNPNRFVSEGDVIEAYISRAIAHARAARSPGRSVPPVNVMTAVDLRSRVGADLYAGFPRDASLVQNAVGAAYTFWTRQETRSAPLGRLAAKVRSSIAEQATEAQARAMLRWARELQRERNKGKNGGAGWMPHYGEPGTLEVFFSNWTKARFWDTVDFGPAVVRKGPRADEGGLGSVITPPGRLAFFHAHILEEMPFRNVFSICGKDHGGNYWIIGALTPDCWRFMEEQFRRDSE